MEINLEETKSYGELQHTLAKLQDKLPELIENLNNSQGALNYCKLQIAAMTERLARHPNIPKSVITLEAAHNAVDLLLRYLENSPVNSFGSTVVSILQYGNYVGWNATNTPHFYDDVSQEYILAEARNLGINVTKDCAEAFTQEIIYRLEWVKQTRGCVFQKVLVNSLLAPIDEG